MGFFTKLFFGDVKKREQEQREVQAAAFRAEESSLLEKHAKKFPYLASLKNIFEYSPEPVLCDCCKDETKLYSALGVYGGEKGEYEHLCPDCVVSGVAAEQVQNSFNRLEDGVEDPAEAETVMCKTPALPAKQEYRWKVCCGKPCVYLKRATRADVDFLSLWDKLKQTYHDEVPFEDLEDLLGEDEYDSLLMLFRCKTCGKIHAIVDLD